MVENEQENDEYRFVELDNPNDEQMSEEERVPESSSFSGGFQSQKNIKRNALIAIAVIILLMFLYKVLGYVRSEKKEAVVVQKTQQQPATPVAFSSPPAKQAIVSAPIVNTTTITSSASSNNSALTQKVNALELSQQSIQTDMSSISQQVNTFNNNISNVNNQLNNLQQVINNLSTQLEKQSQEIALLTEKAKPKKVLKHSSHLAMPTISYAIQAIIPGRAWLIASNGSTITVREGTKVNGYGTVNLIDALEGRVLTSSGKVIRFSQEDS